MGQRDVSRMPADATRRDRRNRESRRFRSGDGIPQAAGCEGGWRGESTHDDPPEWIAGLEEAARLLSFAEPQKLADGTRPNQKGTFAKPRRSTRRCESRDEQFVVWRDAGPSAKDIAAKWNRDNDDDVSEGNVRQILSRKKV